MKGYMVKQKIILGLLLCLTGAAYANPVVFDPVGSIANVLVLGSALVVEAGIVTLILLFWGTDTKPVYVALFVGNMIVYFTVFLPLLNATSNLWIAEALIVVIDGVLIKVITIYDTFRLDTFRPLRWGYAFLIAAVGNVISYYVGAAMSR